MRYLSELLHKQVITTSKQSLGYLSDCVFVASETPYITKIQIQTKHNQHILYPVQAVKAINGTIVVEQCLEAVLSENEVFLVGNVLDKQVIDIKGKNIVRVNDIVIQDKPELIVSGIDIGVLGITRWFGLEKQVRFITRFCKLPLTDRLLPWSEIQPLELTRGKVVLNREEDKLKAIEPEDLADYLEKTTIHNALKILGLVTDETASEVIQNLHITYQTQIVHRMSPHNLARIITTADPDEAVDLLQALSHDKREETLQLLTTAKRDELTYLLSFTHTQIGELMTTEFLTFQPTMSIKKVIEKIRRESIGFDNLAYGYVLNTKQQLIGVFSMHELLMQSPDTLIMKCMTQNVVVTYLSTPRSVALKRMVKYRLRALPVIDEHRKILGIVTLDDMIEPLVTGEV